MYENDMIKKQNMFHMKQINIFLHGKRIKSDKKCS